MTAHRRRALLRDLWSILMTSAVIALVTILGVIGLALWQMEPEFRTGLAAHVIEEPAAVPEAWALLAALLVLSTALVYAGRKLWRIR